MKRIPVIHLARVLRVLILAVLVMNILCLLPVSYTHLRCYIG